MEWNRVSESTLCVDSKTKSPCGCCDGIRKRSSLVFCGAACCAIDKLTIGAITNAHPPLGLRPLQFVHAALVPGCIFCRSHDIPPLVGVFVLLTSFLISQGQEVQSMEGHENYVFCVNFNNPQANLLVRGWNGSLGVCCCS